VKGIKSYCTKCEVKIQVFWMIRNTDYLRKAATIIIIIIIIIIIKLSAVICRFCGATPGVTPGYHLCSFLHD
jgi:hypothetical protein